MSILSCCTKGDFYADLALLYSKATFYATNSSIKCPYKNNTFYYLKGVILC